MHECMTKVSGSPKILLAYACSHNIKLYQMYVKSAFLNGVINELVYVEQPVLKIARNHESTTYEQCSGIGITSKIMDLATWWAGASLSAAFYNLCEAE